MSDGTYRSPRVWRDLRDWGERIGENRVARLTRQSHLQACHKRRRGAQCSDGKLLASPEDRENQQEAIPDA